MSYDSTHSDGRTLRNSLPLIFLCLAMTACAQRPLVHHAVPPLIAASPASTVEDIDPLALTPAMQAFLQRYILSYDDPDLRLDLLVMAVTRKGLLDFEYQNDRTLTAAEAFRMRTGNCLSFANLTVALARAAGLSAHFQEVELAREWYSVDETLLLAKHINVVVSGKHYRYVLDVSGEKLTPDTLQRTLSDAEAKALYFNNLGVDALLANDLPQAHAYMAHAIATDMRVTGAWVNLGVVLSRNGQLEDAILAHRAALDIDHNEYAAMSNLYGVHLARGDLPAATEIQRKVERYRRKNPYYLLRLSDVALAEARFEDSVKLLKRAISRQDDDHQLHFALAKSHYLSGQRQLAENSFNKARSLAPAELSQHYQRPLAELVATTE